MNTIEFTKAYTECALWSSTDSEGEPMDGYDLATETTNSFAADCAAFLESNADDLSICGLSDSQAGHDFWLTRNRHGAGFWDRWRGCREEKKEPGCTCEACACKRLTEAAHVWGSVDLYLGDDELVYAA